MPAEGCASSPYAGRAYAGVFAGDDAVVELPGSGACFVRRAVGDTREWAAPYPLLDCARWDALADDLAAAGDGAAPPLAAFGVAHPLGAWTEEQLRAAFPDVARPFKEHFVVDLERPVEETATPHHRRDARRGLRRVEIDHIRPVDALGTTLLQDWQRLYDGLVHRHGIQGPATFGRAAFERLWSLPELEVFAATKDGATVAMQLWLVGEEHASYHLAAHDDQGYRDGAGYALTWSALEAYGERGLRRAHLGAGAGGGSSCGAEPDDGLTRFKRGWSTDTASAWFCGRILDQGRYAARARSRGEDPGDTSWFPVYRRGEVG